MTRALLLLLGLAGVGVAVAAQQPGSMRPDYDLVITNGRVLDGSGNPWFSADIAISGDRIVGTY